MRLTICVSNAVENVTLSPKITPQIAQISKLFMKEQTSDFRIVCAFANEEERTLPVHKAILSVSSPYFRAMFQPETAESQTGHVTLTVVPYKALYELLYCIYHGEHSSNFHQHALDVMFGADFFEMLQLRDFTANFLARNFDKDSVFRVIHAALQLNMNRLSKQACEYVKLNVPEEEAVSLYMSKSSRNARYFSEDEAVRTSKTVSRINRPSDSADVTVLRVLSTCKHC